MVDHIHLDNNTFNILFQSLRNIKAMIVSAYIFRLSTVTEANSEKPKSSGKNQRKGAKTEQKPVEKEKTTGLRENRPLPP
jgi:hypothetical protein